MKFVALLLTTLLLSALLQLQFTFAWTTTSSSTTSSASSRERDQQHRGTVIQRRRRPSDVLVNPRRRRRRRPLLDDDDDDDNEAPHDDLTTTSGSIATTRRRILGNLLMGATASLAAAAVMKPETSYAVVSQAVGSGEEECRAAGNCLETGNLDAAVGWKWGGANRCDPTDPMCGSDGKLREEIKGQPVPKPPESVFITHIAAIQIDIGRGESGVLRLGLYGKDCPGSVAELIDFFTNGLTTLDSNANAMGATTKPVALASGGIVDAITPDATVDFGVPSQSNAYGRSKGLARADKSFVPQPKPNPSIVSQDKDVRSHDAAGLISISKKGLGYSGTGFESDDETYESSFLITASSVPSLDRRDRRVVGQILDGQSMALLERLSTLPTQKGLKGVIPGQNSGPPLLKVVVRDVAVSKVTNLPNE